MNNHLEELNTAAFLLNQLLKNERLSSNTLCLVCNIKKEDLENILTYKFDLVNINNYACNKLLNIAMFLTSSFELVSPDDRIKGILDILINEYNITLEQIAYFAKLSCQEIEEFLLDPSSINLSNKYMLSSTVLMLHYIFK